MVPQIIRYLAQEKLDVIEGFLGRKLTWEEKDKMYSTVVVPNEAAANRLVDHFRSTGHIAFIDNEGGAK